MTDPPLRSGAEVAALIASSGLTIYDPIDRDDPLFFDMAVLEGHLRDSLRGLRLDYPPRTRAKYAKQAVCQATGYPVPGAFRRTRPRFPGQDLDVYVQRADNLQVWNEDVSPTRRYVLIRPDAAGRVVDVRVVTGETVARWDRTGTLTQKYQARRRHGREGSRLVSAQDTDAFRRALRRSFRSRSSPACRRPPGRSPGISSRSGRCLIVSSAWSARRSRIEAAIRIETGAKRFTDWPAKRWDSAALRTLGSSRTFFARSSRSSCRWHRQSTLDWSPDSEAAAETVGPNVRHRDVRYAVAYAEPISAGRIRITAVVVAIGADFFSEFQRFEGLVRNTKRQIPLPAGLFR